MNLALDDKSLTEITDYTLSSAASISDYSCSSHDDGLYAGRKKVRFGSKLKYYKIASCLDMDVDEMERLWYLPGELDGMKNEARAIAAGVAKHKKEIFSGIKDGYNHAKFVSESGMSEDELDTVRDTSVEAAIQLWHDTVLAGESCRGLENRVLQSARGTSSKECRQLVMDTLAMFGDDDSSCEDLVAQGYHEASRHEVLFAQMVARADEIAA